MVNQGKDLNNSAGLNTQQPEDSFFVVLKVPY